MKTTLILWLLPVSKHARRSLKNLDCLEWFKNHLRYRDKNPNVGGPKDLDSLFSIEKIKNDFKDYEVLVLEEREVELNEGKYHVGTGSVVRFLGRKR